MPEERSDVEEMPRERSKRRSRKNRPADIKEEDADEQEEKPRRRHRRRPRKYEDEDDDEKAGREVAPSRPQRPQNLEQRRTQEPLQPTPQEKPDKGGKQPLRLRLDLNLEVDIELRARIHGDLTLALL